MEKVRAKFVCNYIQDGFGDTKTAHFNAVYNEEGENKDFAAATPGGNLVITINAGTPAAETGFFEQGQTYYLVFTKAPK